MNLVAKAMLGSIYKSLDRSLTKDIQQNHIEQEEIRMQLIEAHNGDLDKVNEVLKTLT